MNDWQSPVDAEPSLGTPHPKTQMLYSGDPPSTNVQSINISGYVPKGTTLVYVYFNLSSTTEGDYVYMTNAAGTQAYAITAVIGAGGAGYSQGIVPVDANRLIYFKISNTRVTGVDITMHFYWL